jgi:hypothetical protein
LWRMQPSRKSVSALACAGDTNSDASGADAASAGVGGRGDSASSPAERAESTASTSLPGGAASRAQCQGGLRSHAKTLWDHGGCNRRNCFRYSLQSRYGLAVGTPT